MNRMKAVILTEPTIGKEIKLSEKSIPIVKPGWVLIRVKAFGLNHSEKILRLSEIKANYIKKPIIPGIECVGEIIDPSDSSFKNGQKVLALMGGMGRNFDGSYAEYVLAPTHHVFSVKSSLSWEQLGAIPETFYTAWGSLFESLQLSEEDHLLIRGGTCGLGYAAIQLAKAFGCKVTATTHKEEKLPILNQMGVDVALIDDGMLLTYTADVTKILELVGAKTLKDSLQLVKLGGIVCHTGILGGQYQLQDFDPIKEIPNNVYLTSFYSNYPTQKSIDQLLEFIQVNRISPTIGQVYPFAGISQACEMLDSGLVEGKIVIKM